MRVMSVCDGTTDNIAVESGLIKGVTGGLIRRGSVLMR